MMKNVFSLILSLLFLTLIKAYPSQQQIADSGLAITGDNPESGVSPDAVTLDYTVSETAVKGFVIPSTGDFAIQLGAFRLKLNAEAFLREVRDHIDKNAIMIEEDGYYKVRISKMAEQVQEKNDQPAVAVQEEVQAPDSASRTETGIASLTGPGYEVNTRLIPGNNTDPGLPSDRTEDIIFLNDENPWLKRIDYFGKSIAFVNALIITITVSIATMLILLMIILLNRRRMEKEEKLRQYLLEKYQGLIVDYLFGNANPDDFRPIASDTYRRQVLIDQMIDVSVNLKGEEAKKMLSLYKHLGLDRDSIKRANDMRWHKKVKGFRELAFMNIRDANDSIYKALNSPNEILRMEAQIALVRLGDGNPFNFLSHLTRPFSLWEQITLHELIIQHNIPVPEFKNWLGSPNPTVAMFALRMIREFKQKDSEDGIMKALQRPEPEVRQLAVQVAGDLEMRSTLEVMKHMYKTQDYNICLEIVRSMGKMPDLSMMGFLKLVLDKEDDVQLQIEATKAIENNGEEGVKALVKLMKSEYKNYNIIVRHVLDRRIF